MAIDYHGFVFDEEKREFVGNFEQMYQAEKTHAFDSWRQDDLSSRIDVQLMKDVLTARRYEVVVDIGCGKGALTSWLQAHATRVIGLDISDTAIAEASTRLPDVEFRTVDIGDPMALRTICDQLGLTRSDRILVVMSQVLSYLERWPEVLSETSRLATDVLIALFIPADPIGFVKSIDGLIEVVQKYGRVIDRVEAADLRQYVILASSKGT